MLELGGKTPTHWSAEAHQRNPVDFYETAQI
jgi:hypothetical protein